MDFVEFVYASGEASVVGEGKGEEQEPFDLEPGEAPGPSFPQSFEEKVLQTSRGL